MQAFDVGVKYDIEPKTTSPYNSGKMSKETHNNAIKLLNSLRFAAGLSHNIGLTDSYNKLAQDASLLCSVNDFLSHFDQPKPKNMNKNLYDSGAKGCASCNLGQGHIHINDSILGWVSDEDSGNFDRMGHRRWVLNPTMKDTGFGLVKEFSGMYSLDRNCPENKNTNVIWPTQNMPIEFFGDNYPWTLSTGRNITKKVVVTLTNKKTKKVIKFDKYTNNKFLVNNDGYGLTGCVIFRPNLKYSDGDSYQVDVNCTDFSVSYDVTFFNLKCIHNKEIIGTIKSSCVKKGKKIVICDKCGIFEEDLELDVHDEEILSLTEANCIKKGKKIYECITCCQHLEEEIGLKPHDYITKPIKGSYKVEATCKVCNKKIQFIPPTKFNLWWKKGGEEGNYSSAVPRNNPIDSSIFCYVEGVNGDSNYNEIIFEVSDPSLLKLPKKIENGPYNELKVLGSGMVELTIYPRYNPSLKKSVKINLG